MKKEILQNWYGKSGFGKYYWDKPAIARAKELGLSMIPNIDNGSPENIPTPELASKYKPEIQLDPDRHTWNVRGQQYWFYPALLEDIYDETEILYYKKQLYLPALKSIGAIKPFEKRFIHHDKLVERLNNPDPEVSVHTRNFLYLAIQDDGHIHPALRELLPEGEFAQQGYSRPEPEFDRKPNLEERQKLSTKNHIEAYFEIFMNTEVKVNTMSLAKKKTELDNATTLVI